MNTPRAPEKITAAAKAGFFRGAEGVSGKAAGDTMRAWGVCDAVALLASLYSASSVS